jgi:transcriptional regulator with XRE-family HTH domain
VARIRLATLFKDARERAGRSLDDLAHFLDVSAPQASRLDSGARGFRPEDVPRLAEWYGFGGGDAQALLALAEESKRREWWQQVDLPDAYRTFIGVEQEAESIAEYGVSVVPGLLQTPGYARAAASVGDTMVGSAVSEARVEMAVEVRMRRQAILDRPAPPQLTVVIDEAILARGPRDASIRLAQLKHLRDVADRPGITLQVIGFEFGLHPGGNSHFILLSLGKGLPDLYYSEGLRGALSSSAPDIVDRYRLIWNELRAKALDEHASKNRVDRYIRDVR